MKKSLTDRRTDDGHRVMGKDLADIVSWAKNSSMVIKSRGQVSDIILDACMKIQNYPIKTVGGDAFYSHYIL